MSKWVFVALAVALIVTTVVAQQPGQRQGGRGGPGRGGPGGFMGGMVLGQIQEVDLNTGVMSVQARGFGGPEARLVVLQQTTELKQQVEATVGDLVIGEPAQVVSGGQAPMRITAGEGAPPNMGMMGMMMGAPGGFLIASGQIINTDPLEIQISEEASVQLNPTDETIVTKIIDAPDGALQAGAMAMCTGQPEQDGSFVATRVLLLPPDFMQGMGPGPGGFGGPGGPGGGRGAQ